MYNSLSSQTTGLSSFIYIPEYGTFDDITEKGDINLQIASGALTNIDFPSIRASYGVYKNLTIGANLFSFGSSSPNINAQLTRAFLVSIDAGLFKEISYRKERSLKLHTSVSYGQGMVHRTFENFVGDIRLGIQRYSLIGGAMLNFNRKVALGIGMNGKFFNYSDEGASGDVLRSDLEKFGRIIEESPAFLLDLNTRVAFGDDFAKFFFNWDFALINFKDESDLISDLLAPSAIHIGFNVLINKAINKIKIKRNEKF